MIKYLGSKLKLLDFIGNTIQKHEDVRSVIDLFAGTSRVGHHLKGLGYQVISNDINQYAFHLANCHVVSNLSEWEDKLPPILNELNNLKLIHGYFTETFCVQSQFFQPKNGMKIDAIREWIAERDKELHPELKSILLASLMKAGDRVDSTQGQFMAYLKSWAPRSHNDLELRIPPMLNEATHGKAKAFCGDALKQAKVLSADLAYLDPPYNQHKYLGNYHTWESLVRWDKPDVYGKAKKRIDVRERKSPFNSKPNILNAMKSLVADLDVKHMVVSFSNEGYIEKHEMIELLSTRGDVFVQERSHARYVGAKTGIHSTNGKKVGKVSHTQNKEFLFVVST